MFQINYMSENLRAKVSSSFEFFAVAKFELVLVIKSLSRKNKSILNFLGEAKYKRYPIFKLFIT